VGIFAIAVGTSSPWIQRNPAHDGYVVGSLPGLAINGPDPLLWAAIVVTGFLIVEAIARQTDSVDYLLIRRHVARLLGMVALRMAVLILIQYPPILAVKAWVVTTSVYVVAIGGILSIGSSLTHRLPG
jgi:hypothetical protein